jgi:hypothetical protein
MKLVTIALLSSLAAISFHSSASNNTYVYSNTEYCELAADQSVAAHLDAYSRKLGYKPSATECRQLLAVTENAVVVAADQNVKQMLREMLRGSTIRPGSTLARKMSLLPQHERQQVLDDLLGR